MDRKIAVPVLLSALALFLTVSADTRTLAPEILQCIEKENVPRDAVIAYGHDGNFTLVESFPNLKCFSACILETAKQLDGCTLLHKDEEQGKQSAKDLRESKGLDFCKDAVKSGERCECGYELFKCLKNYYNDVERQRND